MKETPKMPIWMLIMILFVFAYNKIFPKVEME